MGNFNEGDTVYGMHDNAPAELSTEAYRLFN
jgi:hypothetical protein